MQRVKGHGNQDGVRNGTENNEHENINSWAHQGYNAANASMAASAYSISNYYGTSYHFPAYCMGDGTSAWPNNEAVAYVGNYNGQLTPEAAYSVDGVYNAAGYSAPYNQTTAAAVPNTTSFNYYPGNAAEYPAWNAAAAAVTAVPNKQYENYYREGATVYNGVDALKGVDHRLQTLDIASDSNSNKMHTYGIAGRTDSYSNASSGVGEKKATTWASIAKQPAKPIPQASSGGSKKKGPGMPPPPMVPGRHNIDLNSWEPKNNSVPKIPVAQAPPPPAATVNSLAAKPVWNGPVLTPEPPAVVEIIPHFEPAPPPAVLPPPPAPVHLSSVPIPTSPPRTHKPFSNAAPVMSRPPPMVTPTTTTSYQQTPPIRVPSASTISSAVGAAPLSSSPEAFTSSASSSLSAKMASSSSPPQSDSVVDKLRDRNNYNPSELELPPKGTRFFVIKSYSEDDVHRSIKYEIWCSTEHGNKRLDDAFADQKRVNGAVYLFFSVNGSGHFCGMARMVSPVDYGSSSSVWAQDKWKGQFRVRWIYVKDVPNAQLRHIRLENNENKPVTNSRDTQEVPFDKGLSVLKTIHSFSHTTSIFDDFTHYEKRQEEGDCNKRPPPLHQQQGPPMHQNNPMNRNNLFGNRSMQHKDRDGGNNGYGPMSQNRRGGTRNGNNAFSNHRNYSNDLRS